MALPVVAAENAKKELSSKDGRDLLKDENITKTQWGAIRAKATAANNVEDILVKLYSEYVKDQIVNVLNNQVLDNEIENICRENSDDAGFLMHGVAAERIWNKNNGRSRKKLLKIIVRNYSLGTTFVAKFAAEMAKKVKK